MNFLIGFPKFGHHRHEPSFASAEALAQSLPLGDYRSGVMVQDNDSDAGYSAWEIDKQRLSRRPDLRKQPRPVLGFLASHGSTFEGDHEFLASLPDDLVRVTLAENRKVSPQNLFLLVSGPMERSYVNDQIVNGLMKNPKTSSDDLEKLLVMTMYSAYRKRVAQHKKATPKILKMLSSSKESKDVREPAKAALEKIEGKKAKKP